MQKKWFGKRGTNLLGFMITTNALDEADKLQGVKDVEFVFMVTDDCLTDAWEVACTIIVLAYLLHKSLVSDKIYLFF
jgi:hypothetical protein